MKVLKNHIMQIHSKETGAPTIFFKVFFSVPCDDRKSKFWRGGSNFVIRKKQQKWNRTSKMHFMAIILKSNKKKKKRWYQLKDPAAPLFSSNEGMFSLVQLREYFAAPNNPATTILKSAGTCSVSFTLRGMESGCSLSFDGCLEKQRRDQHILDLRQSLCAWGSCEISLAGDF